MTFSLKVWLYWILSAAGRVCVSALAKDMSIMLWHLLQHSDYSSWGKLDASYMCVCSSTIKRVTQIISWHGHFLCLNSSVFIFMLFFMAAHISLHLCWWLTNHLSRWRFLPCLAHVTTSICLQVFLYFLKRMFLNSTLRWAGDRWHVGITKCIFFFFITGFSWLKTCPMKIWRSVTGARWVWSLLFAPNCVCDSSPVNCILL